MTPFTLMAGLGATIALERPHGDAWELRGIAHPPGEWVMDDWYPDAGPCLERLRDAAYRVAAVGNTPAFVEQLLHERMEVLGSSESWGIAKPDPRFFERIVGVLELPAEKIAYVGDRVDNDITPALAAGLVAVHVRRGPWGHLQRPPVEAIRIESLDELPAVLP